MTTQECAGKFWPLSGQPLLHIHLANKPKEIYHTLALRDFVQRFIKV